MNGAGVRHAETAHRVYVNGYIHQYTARAAREIYGGRLRKVQFTVPGGLS